ncbi:hypothetical protein D9758_004625 [Tetrapyrgos nigripes]|uniref:Cation/H+ exchanger transmembrane domain-containing protein n=1 Tax=Tetrapyrgos nigripes TaxID=182062 RepID=A0A8H5H065_9AGAR|nr:hypothetical protein D9758_004625 [Tetrapyrgos nigripes]
MTFDPFQVTTAHITYLCLGGFVVFFGMFSLFLREKLYVGEACWAFLFGVIIGPYGANIFNPRSWGNGSDSNTDAITLEFTRVVLAIGVFAIGVELPKAYMKRHWRSLLIMLGPVMTWGWFVSAAFIYALIPGLDFLSALCVAACLTPTDPILAAAVVGGKYADKNVPAHLRNLLAAESACNDGAAYPFLFLALYLITEGSTKSAVRDWFLLLWLYQIILGVVLGSLIGTFFRYLIKYCEAHDLIDRHSAVAQYLSLAMLTVGVVVIIGSDDLLAAFFCGSAFAWDGFFNRQTEESVFSSVIDLLFNIASFIFVGAWMPFSAFDDKEELTLEVWRLVIIAILVLLFRRLPVVIALYKWIPDIKTFREAIFSGHFGPMGIGAVFISTLAAGFLNDHIAEVDPATADGANPQTRLVARVIQPVCAFMVLCSILIHGLSIPGFSLSRRLHTATRSLSRHPSISTHGDHAAPEWTTQARHVNRGDEAIVMNKDSEHLAHEIGEDEIDRAERGEKDSFRDSILDGDDLPAAGSPMSANCATTAQEGTVQSLPMTLTSPASQEEIVEEWQEGPHRIIERRRGAGEEVEVEVVRDWFYPSHAHGGNGLQLHLPHLLHLPHASLPRFDLHRPPQERSTDNQAVTEVETAGNGHTHPHHTGHQLQHERKFFRGSTETVKKEVGDYLMHLEQKAKHFEEGVVEGLKEAATKLNEEAKHIGLGGLSPGEIVVPASDDEDGWASDPSEAPMTTSIVTRTPSSASGSRSRSYRTTRSKGKRPSLRRASTTSSNIAHSRFREAAETELEDTNEWNRGRPAVSRTSAPGDQGRPRPDLRPRQTRLDSLRRLQSMPSSALPSRDHSPARSIRFVDEPPRSGAATPRRSSTLLSVASSSIYDSVAVPLPGTPPAKD